VWSITARIVQDGEHICISVVAHQCAGHCLQTFRCFRLERYHRFNCKPCSHRPQSAAHSWLSNLALYRNDNSTVHKDSNLVIDMQHSLGLITILSILIVINMQARYPSIYRRRCIMHDFAVYISA